MKTRSVSRQGAAAAQSEHYRAFATIDAAGHVGSPGFVDGRTHAVDAPLGRRPLCAMGWPPRGTRRSGLIRSSC